MTELFLAAMLVLALGVTLGSTLAVLCLTGFYLGAKRPISAKHNKKTKAESLNTPPSC